MNRAVNAQKGPAWGAVNASPLTRGADFVPCRAMSKSPALFLDRDGTIIHDVDFIHNPEDVRLMPGAREALHACLNSGYKLFILTNQSGIGRGYFKTEDYLACHERLLELLELPAPGFTDTKFAPERPDQPSLYRKPSPRFIHEMIETHGLDPARSWMVGDRKSDWEAGLNAGIRAAAFTTGGKPYTPAEEAFCAEKGVVVHPTLADFVRETLGLRF